MDFVQKMRDYASLEAEIMRMAMELKEMVEKAVSEQPFQGKMLNDGSNGGAAIGVLPLSRVSTSENWSSEYHLPPAQANAVRKRLSSCNTPTAICKAISEMLDEKKVKMGSSNNFIYLNNETLRILRESELGKFVEKKEEEKSS